MKMLYKKQKGEQAERDALRFLQSQGYLLLAKNYYCFFGEIDLIMQDHDTIVFVEVRSRIRMDYGHALETINRKKQKKLIKAAMHYLQKKQWLHKVNSRFDIIAIQFVSGNEELEWIKNAFCLTTNF